ncbi:HNH endonuclease signature motif containing protein [Cellulomonas gilvus]|uniref:HNH nuclease n=1 Tax=Cellulomonas gilvus (strain ATCC 13127 / NRRL B-14078) TaxID=593907 RepID=F8A6K6_CELGA|nr:HNH endonuclease signature motif containing protein [Cellulomonas gilvus]AEI13494.1 HNH nuclease [Cellulomonas gilvus ATCC 13127]
MFETGTIDGAGGAQATGLDVLAELEALSGQLSALVVRAASAPRWGGATRARVLGLLDRLPGLVAGVRSPVLVAQQSAAEAVGGERSFLDARARLTGSTRFQAEREVRTAQALGALGSVRDAVVGGVMPVGHADVLARTLDAASAQVGALLRSPEAQAKVVELARGADAREFSRSLSALVAEHDASHLEHQRDAARRARFLVLSHSPEGTFLKGRLDPVAGHALARALDATGHRQDAERSAEQARADALTALAQHASTAGTRSSRALTQDATAGEPELWRGPTQDATADDDPGGSLPDGAGTAPAAHVSLLVPAATWVAVRTAASRRRERAGRGRSGARTGFEADGSSGVGSSGVTAAADACDAVRADGRSGGGMAAPDPAQLRADVPRLVPAVSEEGTVLSADELAVALCDCTMTRVVMGAQGVPLDVGRGRRMFGPAQRLAVVARDRQCAWNGCSVAARYCEVHHVRWWHRDRGPSDVSNGVLLCSFHHHEVHRLDLDIEPVAGPREAGPVPGAVARRRYTFRTHDGRIHNGPPGRPPDSG